MSKLPLGCRGNSKKIWFLWIWNEFNWSKAPKIISWYRKTEVQTAKPRNRKIQRKSKKTKLETFTYRVMRWLAQKQKNLQSDLGGNAENKLVIPTRKMILMTNWKYNSIHCLDGEEEGTLLFLAVALLNASHLQLKAQSWPQLNL